MSAKDKMARLGKDVGDLAKKGLGKAADSLAACSQLSPKQRRELEQQREDYLRAQDGDQRAGQNAVSKCLGAIQLEVTQAHLLRLSSFYRPDVWAEDESLLDNRIRFFDVTKWVVDSTEKNLDKLVNVYQVLSDEDCTIALIYTRRTSGCTVTMAVKNRMPSDDPSIVRGLDDRFRSAFSGNFPGSELGDSHTGIPSVCQALPAQCAVASVSNLPSEKSEDFISQSIEKLLDGIIPQTTREEYSIVLLASPSADLPARRQRLCELYTALSPYATWQKNESFNESLSQTAVANAGLNAGANIGLNAGAMGGLNAGVNIGVSLGRSSIASRSNAVTTGSTATYTDYVVKHEQELLESQVKRMDQCSALGMWDFAAYVISSDYSTANNVAHMYLSLTQGEQSYMEQAAINLWSRDRGAANIVPWLKALEHPRFLLDPDMVQKIQDCLQYPVFTTATTALSGAELAHALNFPRKSVSGLPVYECVPFGREVVQYGQGTGPTVPLGVIYHMRREESAPVLLDRDSLTAHVFITGSTGAGKSNTIYALLNELSLRDSETKFLVIEPAKGEYKQALGGYPGVQAYGTNPKKTPLLRLNPFSFPEDVHILEHIDRLVEVFNACWPMYAAMPAVLKASVELAYRNCGWNLSSSGCLGGNRRFPTFRDVMRALPTVVDSKGFSNDTRGDYKGALLTRLESMTNGIYGQVLCAYEDLPDEALFDSRTIVDLSRVGSSETKALLMGVLVLKLQEHRMAQRSAGVNPPNSGLMHVTVLEEAHNLLRRTSSEQTQESSNLQGKSVEMLTNAIAEMRSYGEGFIIADQSPGLLDMAVIRNTNTKIILRLPDESDRILVGKAAGLNDDQIIELSRLDTGVAAVYQNHWLEPVLCKVAHFADEREFSYEPPDPAPDPLTEHIYSYMVAPEDSRDGTWLEQEGVDRVRNWIDRQEAGQAVKNILYQVLIEQKSVSPSERKKLLYCLARGKNLIEDVYRVGAVADRLQLADQQIMESLQVSEHLAHEIRKLVVLYAADSIKTDEPRRLELLKLGGVL